MMHILYYDTKTVSPEFMEIIVKNIPEPIRKETLFLPKGTDFKENVPFSEIVKLKKFIDELYYLGLDDNAKITE